MTLGDSHFDWEEATDGGSAGVKTTKEFLNTDVIEQSTYTVVVSVAE